MRCCEKTFGTCKVSLVWNCLKLGRRRPRLELVEWIDEKRSWLLRVTAVTSLGYVCLRDWTTWARTREQRIGSGQVFCL